MVQCLMMEAINGKYITVELAHQALLCRTHRMGLVVRLFLVRMEKVKNFSNILLKVSTQHDIDQLHSPADSENRLFCL